MTPAFLRSRRTHTLLILVGAVVGAQVLLGRYQIRVGNTDPRFVPLALLLGPALLAGLIAVATGSLMQPWERLGCWWVARARVLHAGTVLAVAATLLSLLGAQLDDSHGPTAVVRNLLGLAGLALLIASTIGSTVAWVPPMLLSAAALVLGSSGPASTTWTWLLHPDTSRPAAAAAAVLLGAGVTAQTWRGDRGPASLAAVTG